MPLYRVGGVPAAALPRTRIDEPTAPARTVLRNVLRFTAATILLAACACSAPSTTSKTTFDVAGMPRVDVTIRIPPGHQGEADRSRDAAVTTLRVLGAWLTPFPDTTLDVAADPTRWWTAPASMAAEYAVARPVSRKYWERLIDTTALPPSFVDGLVEYSARRAVSKIVDERYLAVYRGRAEGRYFGGFVPRDLRVPLPVEDDADRAQLTLGTLERWVGRPVFDAILLEFITSSSGTRPAVADFVRVASSVSGQNLSWLFDEALGTRRFDYSVASLDSRPQPGGTFRTTVALRRLGDGVFGRRIPVAVSFADGETVRDFWNGRDAQATLEYVSPSPAVAAEVDPDRMLLLDENRSNNGIARETRAAGSAAARWSARWMIWLEDALLTYVALT